MLRRLPLLALATFTLIPALRADDPTLPIRRVVLYKHGIGYFERQGAVTGRAQVALRFKQDQMSDVLKTLTVLDRGGGRIGAIAYDSQKPPEMVLEEFSFDLGTDNIQQSLLRQLRGAEISADVAGRGPVRGAVLGLDMRVETVDGNQVQIPRLALLTADGEILSADLFDLRSLKFEDQALAGEVLRYLEVLRSTHRRDEKSVELLCAGEGERQIFVSYAVEQPVWKASYRLVVGGPDQGPFLQGWAVVDNTSDEDWVDVDLSLVAGLPVSFRLDLYTPQFRERPWVQIEETAAVSIDKFADAAFEPEARKRPAAAARMKANLVVLDRAEKKSELLERQQAEAITREIGDLLEYRIDHPVTIPRNRSALLPIVSERVAGGKVALYNEAARAGNPMAAVHLHNSSGLTLEGGPVTVLEGETYAGESLIDSIKPDEKVYVPYAVDLGLKATTRYDSTAEQVHKVTFLRGTMLTHYQQVEQKTYTFDNRNDETRTVVVEHPRRNGYQLRKPQQAEDSELDCYRFRMEVEAGKTARLAVIETRELASSFTVSNLDDDNIALFLKQKILNDQAEQMLREVLEIKADIRALAEAASDCEQQLANIDKNQARIRKNLEALGASAEEKDLRLAYVEQLKTDEDAVKRLSGDVQRLQAQQTARQTELDALLAGFALEYTL